MESHESQTIPAKRHRPSMEKSAVGDQHQQEEMEARLQKHWLCNELVHELCLKIPSAKTSDRILLTAHNIYAYLTPRFRRMMIYRDAIAFLKEGLNKLDTKRIQKITITVGRVVQSNTENENNIMINQEQSNDEFVLKTNNLCIRIKNENRDWSHEVIACFIYDIGGQLECAHLHHFLRLIAPLIQPIHLELYWLSKPSERLIRFLNSMNGCIDSIGLTAEQFNSTGIYEALAKYNKLVIYSSRFSSDPVSVPKLIHWLTSNNSNGQSKKYFTLWTSETVTLLVDEMKKDFASATSTSRFVVRLMYGASLAQFTFCNELTGEKLQLRHTGSKYERIIYTLSRCPSNEMDNIESDCVEFNVRKMARICLNWQLTACGT